MVGSMVWLSGDRHVILLYRSASKYRSQCRPPTGAASRSVKDLPEPQMLPR